MDRVLVKWPRVIEATGQVHWLHQRAPFHSDLLHNAPSGHIICKVITSFLLMHRIAGASTYQMAPSEGTFSFRFAFIMLDLDTLSDGPGTCQVASITRGHWTSTLAPSEDTFSFRFAFIMLHLDTLSDGPGTYQVASNLGRHLISTLAPSEGTCSFRFAS